MDECIDPPSQINILLLGESGVGKSTFINAFGNYLKFDTFKSAAKEDLWWVPSIFTIPDENYEDHVIQIGYTEDNFNENLIGVSTTKEPQDYIFHATNETICLIDTPGIGDLRGIKFDEENILNIMQFVKKYTHLNAICFLLKPNITILSEYFKCCITLLFSFLDADAAANVIFVFTNSRSTFYKPGETRTVLTKLLEEMAHNPPYVKVPLIKTNTFCMDNEWFRYKVAMQKGFSFSEKEIASFEESWRNSRENCGKLMNYVLGCSGEEALKPFIIQRQLEYNAKSNETSEYKEVSNDHNLFKDENISSSYNLYQEPMVEKPFEISTRADIELNLKPEFKNSNKSFSLSSEELSGTRGISDDKKFSNHSPVDSVPYSTNNFGDLRNNICDNSNILDSLDDFPGYKEVSNDGNLFKDEDIPSSSNLSAEPMVCLNNSLNKNEPINSSQINILLLGESGVGKSTFINAFGNYLNFDTFKSASQQDLWWVPSIFTIPDENYEDRIIHVGYNEDNFNENLIGVSTTKEPQDYIFDATNERICLIDTPGIGDSRGIKFDEENILNIMQFVKKYTHLNAICFLLKPNISILSEYFKCCITLLFSFLDADAAANVIFVFTNSRSTFYKPGETRTVLTKLLEEMTHNPPYVKVPLIKTNTFCMDNEWFRYKVAMQKGFSFSEKEIASFEESWRNSRETCVKLMNYVLGYSGEEALKPFIIQRQLQHDAKSNETTSYKEVSNDHKLFKDENISSSYNLYAEPMVEKPFEISAHADIELNLKPEFKNSNKSFNLSSEELSGTRGISDYKNFSNHSSVDSMPYSTNHFGDAINYEEINKTKSNLNQIKNLQPRNNICDNSDILDSDSSLDDFPKKKNLKKKKKCRCFIL